MIEKAKIAEAFKEIDALPFPKDSTLEVLRKKFVTGKTDEFFADMLVVYVRSLEGKFKE